MKVSQEKLNQIISLYLQGNSFSEIARKIGVSNAKVSFYLRDHGYVSPDHYKLKRERDFLLAAKVNPR